MKLGAISFSREFSRRKVMAMLAGAAALAPVRAMGWQSSVGPAVKVFDVKDYGAVGDGVTLDSPAIQRAIDAAVEYGGKAQVLVRGGKKYIVGTVQLKGGIDFHLADDASLEVSLRPEDYFGGSASGPGAGAANGAVITATQARGLKISGTGTLHGRAKDFMVRYDEATEIWLPKEFRPKMFVLTKCQDLEVRDITFGESPNWGLHMLGCDRVLVDNVKVRNLLNVPNCDGIDPDHSRDVEIKNCDIVCGDDGIVVKTSRQAIDYGPCANIRVHDCTIETQDAGVKVGTETTSDIHDVRFERCVVKTSSRGICIQLRDEASVYDIDFREITFTSRFYGDPWWGRGEAISLTAIPRTPTTVPGKLHHVTIQNCTGHAENSVRVRGTEASHVHDITFDTVAVTLDRTTKYKGGLYDNRPTQAMEGIEEHDTPGFSIEHADNVTLKDCKVAWGKNAPESFSYAVEAKDTKGLQIVGLQGGAARPKTMKAVSIS